MKRTPEDVCIEYAIAVQAVRDCTRIMRDSPCKEAGDRHFSETGEEECLTQYWHKAQGPEGPVSRPEIEYDEMCDNCKKREQAYRDRFDARKRLGAAKRSIEAVGKRLNAGSILNRGK